MRDLLYRQAELNQLDDEYRHTAAQDSNADDARVRFDRDWWSLERGLMVDGIPERQQWDLALTIRAKLAEYCTCRPTN